MLARRGAMVRPLQPLFVRNMSRVGKLPVLLPESVKVEVDSYPMQELRPIKAPTPQRSRYLWRNRPSKDSFQAFGDPTLLRVNGPLGSLLVPLHGVVSVAVVDGSVIVTPQCGGETKLGRTMWGTTRGYISNAVRGVSQGYRKELELVGVGFRARVEAAGDVKPTVMGGVTKMAQQPVRVVTKPIGMRDYGYRKGAQGPNPAPTPPVENGGGVLVLRIGFSHEVHVPFPDHISISTPTATTINIFGIDKQSVGLAAARIRLMRKPDPYKGKGIRYVGEDVKLKPGKRR